MIVLFVNGVSLHAQIIVLLLHYNLLACIHVLWMSVPQEVVGSLWVWHWADAYLI